MAVEFWDYQTTFGSILKNPSLKRIAVEILADRGQKLTADTFYALTIGSQGEAEAEAVQSMVERKWLQRNRPYYNIYPGIIPVLTRLKLSIDSGCIKVPLPVLNLRFPKRNALNFTYKEQHYEVRTIMMVSTGPNGSVRTEDDGLSIWIDFGESVVDTPTLTYRNFHLTTGVKLEDSLRALPMMPSALIGVQPPQSFMLDCVRLCCTICLLGNDLDIIEPDVLRDDLEAWERTHDQKYVEKAHRRHKVGWNVGKHIEVSPHYRGPCPAALYWTGPGRTVPLIRFRAGCIVHRKKIEELPHGELGPEE